MGAPALRRRFLDWIAFYCYPDYSDTWNSFRKILLQRNAALKNNNSTSIINAWTQQMALLTPVIIKRREQALLLLLNEMESYQLLLFSHDEIKLELTSGYPKELNLDVDSIVQFHSDKLPIDLRYQRTMNGVHVADLKIIFNGMKASDIVSRGQAKMIALLLNLAQSNTIKEKSILAFDDLSSEFDDENERNVYELISRLKQQVFITSTTNRVNDIIENDQLFHVKQGCFSTSI